MTESMGPEWHKLFDMCIVNARKPLFQKAESPFIDQDGTKITNLESLKTSIENNKKVLLGGNAGLLTEYF